MIKLESFFDESTMSVHLRENTTPQAKRGVPGNWEFITLSEDDLKREEIEALSQEIIENADQSTKGFIEMQRSASTIVQLDKFRIVITKPPLSDGWEITAVRPIKKLELKDYELSEKLKERLHKQAEGILIAGDSTKDAEAREDIRRIGLYYYVWLDHLKKRGKYSQNQGIKILSTHY